MIFEIKKHGNSAVILLSKEYMNKMGLKVGNKIDILLSKNKK